MSKTQEPCQHLPTKSVGIQLGDRHLAFQVTLEYIPIPIGQTDIIQIARLLMLDPAAWTVS